MIWRPDYCSDGRCVIEVIDWDTSRANILNTCNVHKGKTFQEIWDESKLKEKGRFEVAKALGLLTPEGEVDSGKVTYEFDQDRNISLSVPKVSIIKATKDTIDATLSSIDSKLRLS